MMANRIKYSSVNLKKILHLLLLINLFTISPQIQPNENIYIVKKGDTVWSISRSNNISITELIRINDIETFANGIPLIKEGDSIFLNEGLSNDYKSFCLDPIYTYQFNFTNFSNEEIIDKCINFFSRNLDPNIVNALLSNDKDLIKDEKFWLSYFDDKRYLIFLENLQYSAKYSKYSDDYLKIVLHAALMGHEDSISNAFTRKDYIFDNFSAIHDCKEIGCLTSKLLNGKDPEVVYIYQNIFLTDGSNYEEFLNYDFNKLNEYEKVVFLNHMLTSTFENGNIEYYKYLTETKNFLENLDYSNRKILNNEFILLINSLYTLLNVNQYSAAREIYKSFLEKLEIKGLNNFYDIALENIYSLDPDHLTSFDIVETFMLNATSVESRFTGYDDFFEYRKKHIHQIEKDVNKRTYADEYALMAWYSDTGYRLSFYNECQDAEVYFSKAFDIYSKNPDNYRADDIQEPLDLADCFIRNKNYKSAEKYTDLSNINLSKFNNFQKIFLNFRIQSQRISIEILKGNHESAFKLFFELSKSIKEEGININPLTRENDFKYFINDYIYQYSFFNDIGKDTKRVISPIELKLLYENIFSFKKLELIKVNENNKILSSLKNKLIENKNQIQTFETLFEESLSKEYLLEIENLYTDRQKIIKQMLSNNSELDNLFNINLEKYLSMTNNLNTESAVLNYTIDNHRISIIVELKDARVIRFVELKEDKIYQLIQIVRDSLNSYSHKFSFNEANKLYKILYEPIYDILENKTDIYLYGSELEGLPLGILVSEYTKSEEITEYQRLIEAKWAIDKHSFARIYPLKADINSEFDMKFLGFANPDSFYDLGLPKLPNSVNELREISLASENFDSNFILTDSFASKKNLYDKTANSFERIVFATHTVPSGWLGLTNESAIVLADENGDYLLSPSEIINLNLSSDIVLLSACNSENDGITDLFKSFLVAGSNSIIYSNWNLETLSAEKYTESVFKIMLFETLPKHQAMRQASIELMNDYSNPMYAHPAFWGNFSIAYRNL